CPIIALEEHYGDDELSATYTGDDVNRAPPIIKMLSDVGAARLKAMDEAGIDIQVLSHTAPSTQKLGPDVAVAMTRRVNDRLAADRRQQGNPGRVPRGARPCRPPIPPRPRTSSSAPSPRSVSRVQ